MGGGLRPPPEVLAAWEILRHDGEFEMRGWQLVILMTVLCSLATIVIGLRLYARFVFLKSGGLDDWMMAISWVSLVGLNITLCLVSKKYGYDKHQWDVPLATVVEGRKAVLAIEMLYSHTTGFTKLSILLFYKRLSERSVSPSLRMTAQITMLVVLVVTVFYTLFPLVQCQPLSAFFYRIDPVWRKAHAGEWHCLREDIGFTIHAALQIVTNFIAFGLPLITFWKLQLPLKEKIVLSIVFFFGFGTIATAITRTIAIINVYSWTYDVTWWGHTIWVLTGIEANVGAICASLPCCRVYLVQYIQPMLRPRNRFSTLKTHKPTRGPSNTYDRDGLAIRQHPGDVEVGSHREMLRADVVSDETGWHLGSANSDRPGMTWYGNPPREEAMELSTMRTKSTPDLARSISGAGTDTRALL